ISENDKSFLEIVSTDYKPVAEIIFAKPKGKEAKENTIINLEEFITIKGINALGNQLTKEKVKQVNLLEPLPHNEPEEVVTEDIEVVVEETVSPDEGMEESATDENGQITLGF